MHRGIPWLVCVIGLSGCHDNETCERGRLSLARAYDNLRQAATERKLVGVAADQWSFIENKTDLLQSAFATPQVTWSSAEKARSEVAGRLGGITTNTEGELSVFRETARGVFQQQDRFASTCR